MVKDKLKYYIGYEYQVIIPLMYIKEHSNCDVIEITQFQMLDYRIKSAQEFAYNNIRVEFETGNNGLLKFVSDYGNYVEIIEIGDDMYYRLKPTFTSDIYEEMISKLDASLKEILFNDEIIKSCFNEKKF